MTDKQPEALAFCWATELAMTQQPVTLSVTEAREVSAGMQRLQAENTALQQGYAAARLEIESLQARIKTMAEEHADELTVAHLDGRMRAAQAVYEVLVNDNYPPAGSNEHWEGWKARLIVDALFPIEAPTTQPAPPPASHGDAPEVLDIPDQCPYFGPSPHRDVWLDGWYARAAQKGKK